MGYVLQAALLCSVITGVSGDRCKKELPCSICTFLADCTFYNAETPFCGEKNLASSRYLFKINKASACTDQETLPIPGIKTNLEKSPKAKDETTTDNVNGDGGEGPLAQPVVHHAVASNAAKAPKQKGNQGGALTLRQAICMQYVSIFKMLNEGKKGMKQYHRCVKMLHLAS